jgi:hypothetical protein
MPPKLDPVSAGRSLVTYAVHRRDVAAVGDGMTALHRFPRGILRRAIFFLLARMPADRRRIKQNLRAAQCGQAGGFRIPLVPANADADLSMRGRPRLETEIAGSEVKLLIIRGIVRDVHLAIFPKVLAVGVDDCRRIMINAGRSLLEKRSDNHSPGFARDRFQLGGRRTGNFLGERKVRVVFRLAKVLGTK